MDIVTLIVSRSLERLIGILLGGFLTWLGYRLFLEIPTKSNSSGDFTLPGGTAIHLTRVGPGIFFSFFGTAILVASFIYPIDFKKELAAGKPTVSAQETGEVKTLAYRGVTPAASGPSPAIQDLRNIRRREIVFLNRLPERLRPDLSTEERNDYLSAIHRMKLAMMEPLWDDEWGDLAAFKAWVNGDGEDVPAELSKPGAYFKAR